MTVALVVMVDLSFVLVLKIDLSIRECYKVIDVAGGQRECCISGWWSV